MSRSTDYIEVLGAAETREVSIHSQAVLQRLISDDHERNEW